VVAVVSAAGAALGGCGLEGHAEVSLHELVAEAGVVEFRKGWAEHGAEGDVVLALTVLGVSASDIFIFSVFLIGLAALAVLYHLALRPQQPRHHRLVLLAYLLRQKFLIALVLVDHSLVL
jgi:hypothetical protein